MPDIKINGAMTLGENIADLGGLTMAYSMRFKFLILIIMMAMFSVVKIAAQDKTPTPALNSSPKVKMPTPLPADLVSFFAGEWSGAGKFASGKEIQADVKFSAELDNQWLLYSHQDRLPNKYKALGMWGIERASDKFLMIVEDNFGGARRFESVDGWANGKIVFTYNNATASTPFLERFTFEKQDDKTFKMTYEASRNGMQWRLGDYLTFTRK